jgi:hypothetical protein
MDDLRRLCVWIGDEEYDVDEAEVMDDTGERVRSSDGNDGVKGLSSCSKGELERDE